MQSLRANWRRRARAVRFAKAKNGHEGHGSSRAAITMVNSTIANNAAGHHGGDNQVILGEPPWACHTAGEITVARLYDAYITLA